MWSKYQTSILISTSFTVLFSMFWFVQPLAMVLLLSLFLTILLNSIVNYLVKKKIPRGIASIITLGSFLALVLWLLVALSKTFIPTFSNFIADIPSIAESLKNIPLLHFSTAFTEQINDAFKGLANLSVATLRSSLELIINLFSKAMDMIMMIFITFYFLKDGKEIKEYLVNLFPQKDKVRIHKLFDHIIGALISYIRGQLAICIITGILVFIYFTVCGLPYASVFAVLSATGELIPVLGPTVASLAGALFATTQFTTLGIQTLCFYVILTQTNHNIVYPYLIGKSLKLHPIAIMLGILLGGQILGILGMFLAVPCMVTIKLVLEDLFHNHSATT
ncbi:AI-2E family transporter [Anaerosinus massiliensis]|uniref:AI-2E family transporter n=1 Tax=Massilibacillus massiliensis TaxID=1806837 RepID=UPI000DA64014|nr:AI-2E family transporter [Massilibacillus massiliensis]